MFFLHPEYRGIGDFACNSVCFGRDDEFVLAALSLAAMMMDCSTSLSRTLDGSVGGGLHHKPRHQQVTCIDHGTGVLTISVFACGNSQSSMFTEAKAMS